MKKSKGLTIYVILFMTASFMTGFLLLYTALLLQWSQSPQLEGEGISSPLAAYLKSFQERGSKSLQIQLQDKSLSFIQDAVCGGCRPTPVVVDDTRQTTTTCGSLLVESNLLHSAHVVASANKECRHCLDCRLAAKRYWRYDRVFLPQKLQQRQVDKETSLPLSSMIKAFAPLSSIPSQHRVPTEALESNNLTSYLLQQYRRQQQHDEYYFEYNPSIVLLPEAMRTTRSAVYLASFRVTNLYYCFRPTDRKLLQNNDINIKAKDYLGLALLNDRLEIVQDVVVDLKPFFPAAQDFRLFLLKNQLYISSYDLIAPIWISSSLLQVPPPPPNSNKSVKIVPIPRVFSSSSSNKNNNDDKNNLQVLIRTFASCAPCGKSRRFCGKNFNYFVSKEDSNSSTTSEVFVEIWPSPPHTVRTVNLEQPCDRSSTRQQLQAVQTIVDKAPPPKASFATTEEIYFYRQQQQEQVLPLLRSSSQQGILLTRGRGGACCLEMKHPTLQTPLLVGIQHVKTPSQGRLRRPSNVTENHYLSQWYAFEPQPPFRIVALSGYFCLGFPTPNNHNSNNNSKIFHSSSSSSLVEATRWRSLVLGERIEACPRIHFVSGLTYAAAGTAEGKTNDSFPKEEVMIAYGINDCVSAVARVSVEQVQQLLFFGLLDST